MARDDGTRGQLLEELRVARQRIAALERAAEGRSASEERSRSVTERSPGRSTERNRSQEDLSRDQVFLQTLLSNVPDYVYFKDTKRRFVRASDSFCHLFGLSMDDIIGKTDEELFPDEISRYSVADDRRVIETGTPTINKEEGGQPIGGAEPWVLTTKLPWRDPSGRIIGLFGISRNITERRKAKETLRQSTEKYRAITETALDSIFCKDRDSRYTFVNAAVARQLGRPASELLGLTPRDLFDEESAAIVEAVDAPVFRGEVSNAIRTLNIQGEDRALHTIQVPLRDAAGDVAEICGIVRDITEQKRAAEALKEKEEQLRTIGDNLPMGMLFQLRSEADGTVGFTYVSATVEELHECTAKEAIADPSLLFNRVVEDDLENWQKARETTLDELTVFDHAMRIRRKSGEIRYHRMISKPRLQEDGAKIFDGIELDITDHKRAERALLDSVEFNETVLSASPVGIATYRANGQCVSTNDAAPPMVGATKEEVLRQNFREIESWKLSGLREDAESALSDGVLRRREIHVRSTFGKEVWLDCRISRFSSSGEPHLLLMIDDISERIRAEEERYKLEAQFRQAQKLESLGVLAAGIAHDFNNMLCGVLGNADLAHAELPTHSPARRNLEEIQRIAVQCSRLTNQMLAYSGKGKLVVETLDLQNLVEDIKDLIRSSVSKRIMLDLDVPSNLPAIRADASQLCQVLMNLVINASEAIGDKSGRVKLAIRSGFWDQDSCCQDWVAEGEEFRKGPRVILEVSDTGCGMDAETRAKIFDPFFTTKLTGRGLGLAALHGIVRGHKGALAVESEPGKGTTFKVSLPALDQPAKVAMRRKEVAPDWRGTGTILVADDEEAMRTMARQMLERLGFAVVTARDGKEAVGVFQKHDADIVCVLLDVTMPGMDGMEAFSKLRNIREDLPVLFSSGFSTQDAVERLAAEGVTDFIHKPYGLAALGQKIRGILLG